MLRLLVLLSCLGTMKLADAAFLCYNFTVKKPTSGTWSQEVTGQLNKKCFIYCNSTKNCYPNGVLGNRLSATKIWGTQVDTLQDLSDLFKQQMSHMKQKNNTIREPLTLQARLHCWHEADGHFNGSWDFDLNGHKMAHVNSSTGEGTEVDPGSRWMKEMWEKDFTQFLKVTLQGDCKKLLEEFESHWEEKLEPAASTTATPHVDQSSSMAIDPKIVADLLSASTTTISDVDQSSSMAIDPKITDLLLILPYFLLLCFLMKIFDNDRLKMLQRSRESSSGAATLPSISLHQMSHDAADTAFHGLHSVWSLGPFLITWYCFSWCALVGFALMKLLEP